MLDIFSGLRLVVKRRNISIDNAIFRCHWFFTSTLLVSFSLVITARQYVGQPIECHSFSKIPDSLLNSYCWVQSTFSVPQACNLRVGVEVPYPCIDNRARGGGTAEVRMFAYYQWVGMVLFIQGLLFHLPYYLWKVWENGLIRALTGGLRVAVLSDQERNKKRDIVVEYIHDHLGCHRRYALKYFLCEFICLVNLAAQLWATNSFFDGQFLRYGLDVMHYSTNSALAASGSSSKQQSDQSSSNIISTNGNQQHQSFNQSSSSSLTLPAQNYRYKQQHQSKQELIDPMTYIFPRVTKCTYYDFGSSGDIQRHDALCLLPLNIINEKIYIALWFWFLVLGLLTVLVIIYRFCAIASESVRCKGLLSRCKLSNELDIRIICRHCDVGDWFLFYMVAENLDPLIMREIVAEIAKKIRAHLELKSELLGLANANDEEPDYLKYKALAGEKYRSSRVSSFETESIPSTRRNSMADEVPLVKKIRKRFSAKRLWSMDLGSGELRQQLFAPQPPINPDPRYQSQASSSIYQASPNSTTACGLVGPERTNSGQVIVSAPPASQMPLGAQPSLISRRGSLSRTASSSSSASTSGSFVMEMQTISGSSSRLNEVSHTARPSTGQYFHRRRLSGII